jgi:hydrogenase maturation factor
MEGDERMGVKAKGGLDRTDKAVTQKKAIGDLDSVDKVATQDDGFDLFMRFADGCRCYLLDKKLVSAEDNRAILGYFRTGKRPSLEVLERVYYVALPGLKSKLKKTGSRDVFDAGAVREFYAFDHNATKVEQGNYACIAFPARVLERRGTRCFLDLEPVRGRFWADSGLEAGPGDWVILHRMNVVEKVPEKYAMRVSGHLRELGLNKGMGFPRAAVRYLKRLNRTGGW